MSSNTQLGEGFASEHSEDQVYAEELKRAWAAFDFDGKDRLAARVVYSMINLNAPASMRTDLLQFEDALDHCDVARLGYVNRQLYNEVNGNLTIRRQQFASKTRRFRGSFFFHFLALAFLPLSFPFAAPIGSGYGGSGSAAADSRAPRVRFVLRGVMRMLDLPYRARVAIYNDWKYFLPFYLATSVFWVLMVINLCLSFYALNQPFEIYVSGLEPAIAFTCFGFATIMLGYIFTLDDQASLARQDKVLEGGRLHQMAVQLQDLQVSAEYLWMLMLTDGPEVAEARARTRTLTKTAALTSAFLLASIPFFCRAYYGMPFLGTCENSGTEEDNDRCDLNGMFAFMSVTGFLFSIPTVAWFASIIMSTYVAFVERNRLFSRLCALAGKADSSATDIPVLSFDHPVNVIAWFKLRALVLGYKSSDLRRVEAILAGGIVILVPLIAAVLYQQIIGFTSPINRAVITTSCGVVLMFLGGVTVHPVLTRGIMINSAQDWMKWFVVEEQWRQVFKSETTTSEMAKQLHSKSAALLGGVLVVMQNIDTTFKVLQVPVTKAFLISLAAPLLGSIAAWIIGGIFG